MTLRLADVKVSHLVRRRHQGENFLLLNENICRHDVPSGFVIICFYVIFVFLLTREKNIMFAMVMSTRKYLLKVTDLK